MRLIDADALIDDLELMYEHRDDKDEPYNIGVRGAINMTRKAPTIDIPHGDDWERYSERLWQNAYERGKADRPQGWIPCSERLPKENTEVLMSLEWGIDIGECRNGDWHSEWINHYDDGNVLAWMPLPKPWKGADDED